MEGCVHAQSVQNFSRADGWNRLPGGPSGRAVQEWQPGDGVKFADIEPTCCGYAANWADGYNHRLSRAFCRWTRNLGEDDSLRQGMARGGERKYDDYVWGCVFRQREAAPGGHV